MKFLYKIAVASEAAQTWEKMQDTLAMVHCIPGVEEADETSEGHYDVKIVTKLGPVSLRFNGSAELEIHQEERAMQAGVTMSDSRSGNVYGQFTMRLVPDEAGNGSILQIDADIVIAGKLGELAQPLIKRKADQIVQEFSKKLTNYLETAQ
ncbi:SRPBCC domain-containing protein [Paenibacillus validus]|uniref:CoxG family protein n=1 Tax=Paenibacillus TaxID=44249 RepID=UPI000FD88334|nr:MULTISPECIES: SRPBCC domain-containing protein [Paenibacillus]MED4601884.1 SRPBCC domain-containing protein [Paenibacillus validus]MED4606434.1 SRPBCC domain-containing protein [Paenibacillus validus]